MLIHVYLLRSSGRRVPVRELIARPPTHGWLQYQQVPLDDYGVRWEAHLLGGRGGKPVLPSLHWARVRRMDGVMHLVGRENCGRASKKATPIWRLQSWMCVFDPADAQPMLERLQRAARASTDPFDEEFYDHSAHIDW